MEGGLEKIQNLEDSMLRNRDEKSSEDKGKAPVFTVPLNNIDNLREGESSHFEARLTPTDDPKLTVSVVMNDFNADILFLSFRSNGTGTESH
jgi:titin